MKIQSLVIKNFKSIRELSITDIDNAFIFVGKNNSGKSSILDAIRAALGDYQISERDFNMPENNIVIGMTLHFEEEDLQMFHTRGIVSKMKKYDMWLKEFSQKLPGFNGSELSFEYIYNRDGKGKYKDVANKDNPEIKNVLPKLYFIDHTRKRDDLQENILKLQGSNPISDYKADYCIFDRARKCNQCFNCIGAIAKKAVNELTVMETTRLLQYKLFDNNLNIFANKLNKNFKKNGGQSQEIRYEMKFDVEELFKINTVVKNTNRGTQGDIKQLSEGFRSIYVLSLLETYTEEKNVIPYIIMIEDPEIYLHPQLQKVASEILYKLSKKNQVIFSTHSPNMIFNFTSKQINQVVVDKQYNTVIRKKTNIDEILDDLGYNANDLMNVNFVFIVEGTQDRSRLPLLLNKYYSEVYDDDGDLQRISIIQTNSCTNIKTYANLKYINKLYLKEQFLMIRDSDGKDREELARQLCRYYDVREKHDVGNLPNVTRKNVLILKYYSFENYFLEPSVMAKIGIIDNEEEFYDILYSKYKKQLYKITSVKNMERKLGIRIDSKQELKDNIENIKIYVRGHNLYDIFYGRYKGQKEKEILMKYIDNAPREVFADILEAIDAFVYFHSRRK
ncbi:MAG: AAA family ATPase [Lachnospiraceae bacterium]|nr:AAA family ATPase [Lachnospiraceae bacterium]